MKKWSEEELVLLAEYHGTEPLHVLCKRHFPDKSFNSVKWQVSKLGLAKKDKWHDWEVDIIKVLKEKLVPNEMIASLLGRTTSAVSIKLNRLGIKAKSRNDIEDSSLREFQEKVLKLDNKIVGTITEDQVKIKLLIEGFDVYTPYMNNHKSDILVLGKVPAKIQVKSASYDRATKRFRTVLRTKNKYGQFIDYKNDDIDFFIAKCNGIEDYYIIPFGVGVKHNQPNFYPQRHKLIKVGEDFSSYRNNWELIKNFIN